MNDLNFIITVEARMWSTRLPWKVLMEIWWIPAIKLMLDRLKENKHCIDIIVATSTSKKDDVLCKYLDNIGQSYYRWSEEDVLERVLYAAKSKNADVIIETTWDCPFIDPDIIDQLVDIYSSWKFDYVANILKRTYADWLDVQIFSVKNLEMVANTIIDPLVREHVSYYFYIHPELYKQYNLEAPEDLNTGKYEITLDTKEDLLFLNKVYDWLVNINKRFRNVDIKNYLEKNQMLLDITKNIVRKGFN